MIELRKAGLVAEPQKELAVYYDDQQVGHFVADVIVNNCIILELKSIRELHNIHEVQLVNYLCATGLEIGLLINFGPRKVEVKRKYRTPKKNT